MKNSYFQTPRRSEDCTFHSWGDPIHYDDKPQHDPDRLVVAACVAIFVALCVMGAVGWLK